MTNFSLMMYVQFAFISTCGIGSLVNLLLSSKGTKLGWFVSTVCTIGWFANAYGFYTIMNK